MQKVGPRGTWLACLLAALSVLPLLAPPQAAAFVRQTVRNRPDLPLYWSRRALTLRPAYESSSVFDADAIRNVLLRSRSPWEVAGDGCTDVTITLGRAATGLETNLIGSPGPDGENRVVFREDVWPDDQRGALALTTTFFRNSTGEILDADIDVNSLDFDFTVTPEAQPNRHDLQNTLTHELGHFVGLSHVLDPDATMYGDANVGETKKRTLEADDEAGICAVYPLGEPTATGTPAMNDGLRHTTLCSAASGTTTGLGWVGWLSAALLLVVGVRRRRRRRS